MCKCMYTCMSTALCAYMYVHMYVWVHVCKYACMCIWMHVCMVGGCMHTYVCIKEGIKERKKSWEEARVSTRVLWAI